MVLKLLSTFQCDDQTNRIHIIPPSAGYYTNIRVQFYSPSPGADPIHFLFGPDINASAIAQLPAATGITMSADFYENRAFCTFQQTQQNPDEQLTNMHTYHFKNKRVHIDEDDLVHTIIHGYGDIANDSQVIITADFIPKKGSKASWQWNVDEVAVSDNYIDRPFTVPITIENCLVEVVLRGEGATQVLSNGELYVRVFDREDEVLQHSMGGPVYGDLLDATDGSNTRRTMKGVLGVVDYATVIGGANIFKKTFAVPVLYSNQMIGFDLTTLEGSAITPDVTIRVSGYVKYFSKSNDGNYMDGSGYHNLNLDGVGGINE